MCLKGLLRYPELQVVGLVTQPDRPAGRGRRGARVKYVLRQGGKWKNFAWK